MDMMRGNGRWMRSWSDANSRLVHNARRVGSEGLRRYWDRRSVHYDDLTRGDAGLREAVIAYLARERILRPGDRVLDIGCGTGQFTLPMARVARTVTGLDISGGMLDRMMAQAGAVGLANIRTARSAWNAFEGEEKYDLVFSAFCPGVNEPDGLFKMERLSRRSCCYVTGGGLGQPAFIYELLWLLTGEEHEVVDTDDFFSFNVLYEAGRKPSVRSFSHRAAPEKGAGHSVENAILYFDMLLGPDKKREKTITEYFDRHCPEDEDGEMERSLYTVYWSPDTE